MLMIQSKLIQRDCNLSIEFSNIYFIESVFIFLSFFADMISYASLWFIPCLKENSSLVLPKIVQDPLLDLT